MSSSGIPSSDSHYTDAILCLRYFNTVGSRDGWTPSQFKSSRRDRHEPDRALPHNLPQHFMDEEDLTDAVENQKLNTNQSFTGVGTRNHSSPSKDTFTSLLDVKRETAGVWLLNRMGWRDGQGIGPKVSRKPRLGSSGTSIDQDVITTDSIYLFAPDDTSMVSFKKKTDRLGFGSQNAAGFSYQHSDTIVPDGQSESLHLRVFCGTRPLSSTSHGPSSRRGFGVGVLNDSSSGEDDPYEIGPKITHIRRVRDPKKAKGFAKRQAPPHKTPAIDENPRLEGTCRREHEAPKGFVRGMMEDLGNGMVSQLPISCSVPASWAPSGRSIPNLAGPDTPLHHPVSGFSTPNPVARDSMLGEPGTLALRKPDCDAKSRFVPASLPELPSSREIRYIKPLSTEPTRIPGVLSNQPSFPTRQAAVAALRREEAGRGPYATQPAKRERYHKYLEYHAGLSVLAPTKPDGMTELNFSKELSEFHDCVSIFKPMVAPMASRFTAAAASMPATMARDAATGPSQITDTPHEAASLGMFGNLTRSIFKFTPSGVLCKRFGVKMPYSNALTREHCGQTSEVVEPCMQNIRSEVPQGERQVRQDHPLAREQETRSAESPSRTADTVMDPGRRGHVSNEVFNAIFGDEA